MSAPGFSLPLSWPIFRACFRANHAPTTANAMRNKAHQKVSVRTAAATSSKPAPYFSASPTPCAVLVRSRSTAPGEVTPSDITSAAAPATCGVAMLVPWNQR